MTELERLKAENVRLKKMVADLEEERRLWLSGQYWLKEDNPRGAGRKSIMTPAIRDEITKHKNSGKTFREIAKLMGYSVGFVHKAYHSQFK